MGKTWKDVEPGVWKPSEEGDAIVGTFVHKEESTDTMGSRYFIENDEGRFLVWGSAVLDNRMRHVKIGAEVRILYEGKGSNKRGQDVNLYKVQVAEEEAEEAAVPMEAL
jgi:hypothetical protein